MKKLIIFLCLMPVMVFTQNYQTINPDVVSYFEPEEDFTIPMWFKGGWSQKHIRCVSIIEQENILEGTLYTNYHELHDYNYELMHWWDGPCVYLDMPSWIGDEIVVKNNGENVFFNRNNDSIHITTSAQLNDSWKFFKYPNNTYFLATIFQFDTLGFLGITDSVKFISLQFYNSNNEPANSSLNGTELWLSKNHGFINVINFRDFPEFSGYTYGVLEHTLVGQTGLTDEYHKLTKGDIYDFNIGDEFHKKITHWVTEFTWYQFTIRKIIDKNVISPETVEYTVIKQYWGHEYNPGSPLFYTYDTVTETYNQLTDFVSDHISFEPYDYDEYSIVYNMLGVNKYNSRPRIIKTNDSYSDWDDCLTHNYFDSFTWSSTEYIKGCGTTFYDWVEDSEYEQRHFIDLVYFKKGEETWGTPLTPPTVEVQENKLSTLIGIYPNPAKTTISIINPSNTKINNVTLYTQTGLNIFSVKAPFDIIDISRLKAGLYFVEIKTSEGIVRKKIIVQ